MMQKDNSNVTNIHNDLREFIELLENEDEIIRIKKNVNSTFELPGIVSKLDGNKAVIFEYVENKNGINLIFEINNQVFSFIIL